jgi:peptide deformylase
MSLLKILEAPHPLLRQKAAPITVIDDALRRLMDDMLETMYAAPGVGLAGPQVGVTSRVVVIDVSKDETARRPLRLVNPEIVWRSEDVEIREEGCLSLPEQFAEVCRPAAVHARFLDERGQERTIEADGLLARCLQHELDHLDGVLFVDHLSTLKRNIIMRKLLKARRLRA